MKSHSAEALGVRFAYPDSFLVGGFADESLPVELLAQGVEPPFRDAVVLVLPADLGAHPLAAIPIGEIPTIWLDRSETATTAVRVLRPDTSYALGELKVSRFPGYPGPYGDEAFYYLVEFPDASVLEVAAHRRRWREVLEPTHFDRVIEAILPTLASIP